ncbi:MAG TPA: hypothetical protein VJ917_00430 [Saprospiraceae bacterium]|nr:hypothetical protein [Saprospiraceae bacterium]
MKAPFSLLFCSFLFISCWEAQDDFPEPFPNEMGVRPVYFEGEIDTSFINLLPPREFQELGNFVLQDDWMFIIELFEGIHVIDNSDPANPETVAFIEVPSARQITADGNALFVNFFDDLVVLDISNIENLRILDVVESFYNTADFNYSPPDYEGFFECVDEKRGEVLGWEQAQLEDPQCWK